METKLRNRRRSGIEGTPKIGVRKFTKQNNDNAKVEVQYLQNHQIGPEKSNHNHTLRSNKQMQQQPQKQLDDDDDDDIAMEDVENIEYLDENACEEFIRSENTCIAEECCIDDSNKVLRLDLIESNKSSDVFYPNAIHCLIALYRAKYNEMQNKRDEEIKAFNIWNYISKEMNESFFTFNAKQIEQKYRQLRQKYFIITTLDEANQFEYFHHLHEIYRNRKIAAALKGQKIRKYGNVIQIYWDSVLFEENLLLPQMPATKVHQIQNASEKIENAAPMPSSLILPHHIKVEEHQDNTDANDGDVFCNNDEIRHKENEIIDLVEKELQEMENGKLFEHDEVQHTVKAAVQIKDLEKNIANNHVILQGNPQEPKSLNTQTSSCVVVKLEQEHHEPSEASPIKRFKLDLPNNVQTRIFQMPSLVKQNPKPQQKDHQQISSPAMEIYQLPSDQPQQQNTIESSSLEGTGECRDFTLADFDKSQQRRHEEKMDLMRQSLTLQERIAEMQYELMQQLINRI